MFKNAVFFRVGPDFRITGDTLSTSPARPCGPTESLTIGFAPPRPDHAPDLLTHTVGDYTLIALETEQRILPSAVIKAEVSERAKTIEEEQGRRVGRRERREIEGAVALELLPKAFTRKKRIYAVFAPGLLIIEGGKSQADMMTEMRHRVVADFPVSRIKVVKSPTSVMTGWLMDNGDTENNLTLDDFCRLVSEGNQSITYRTYLDGDDIPERIAAGYVASRVGVTLEDRASLIITENFEIKKFTLLDILIETAHQDAETEEDIFDIDLALHVGELIRAIDFFTEAFGGEFILPPNNEDTSSVTSI